MSFFAAIVEAVAALFLIGVCAFLLVPMYGEITGLDVSGYILMLAILAFIIVIGFIAIILKKF
ncbi:MAG: hypothetical protein ABFC71_00285 [Methanoregula sp.]|jgi:hypothetical protein